MRISLLECDRLWPHPMLVSNSAVVWEVRQRNPARTSDSSYKRDTGRWPTRSQKCCVSGRHILKLATYCARWNVHFHYEFHLHIRQWQYMRWRADTLTHQKQNRVCDTSVSSTNFRFVILANARYGTTVQPECRTYLIMALNHSHSFKRLVLVETKFSRPSCLTNSLFLFWLLCFQDSLPCEGGDAPCPFNLVVNALLPFASNS
jgi:hypothetical protein